MFVVCMFYVMEINTDGVDRIIQSKGEKWTF